MDLLTAVNTILPWMEENKITTVDTKHPTVAIILEKIDTNRIKLLEEAYWFNSEEKKFYLGTDGKVVVPANLLALYPKDYNLLYEIRGDYIYDLKNSSFQIPAPFEASIRVDLPFEELPGPAARTIMWRACIDAYVPDFGVAQSVQILMQREAEAFALLQREHLRKRQFNAVRTPPGMRYMNALRG